jgi:hypothetical protein
MQCEGYICYRQNTAKDQYTQYAFERNKHLWCGATERQQRLILHEARATMDECNEIMSKHRLGCPIRKADK